MGNKLGRRRQVVDEKYTKPQGLYLHKDVDHKKLRKLILDSKLAPCYPGDDDTAFDLEECPICFLYYPSLNRSRCCTKGICTECFLQMKTPNSTRPTQCPFCKTSNYAVEYRGMKTKEEKGIEQIEEQRVIEANIRMRQQQQQEEEERMQKRQEIRSSSSIVRPSEVEYSSIAEPSSAVEGEEIVSTHHVSATPSMRQPLRPRQNREDEFDLDLEDIMVMEAIWLSIQEDGKHRNPALGVSSLVEQYVAEDRYVSASMAPLTETVASSSSPSGGLACAIAALAERQQVGGDSSSNYNGNTLAYNMFPGSSRFTSREEQEAENYPHAGDTIEVSPPDNNGSEGQWLVDHRTEVSEIGGSSYAGTYAAEHLESNTRYSQHSEIETGGGGLQTVVPESFEEQMMLAMAVSLAEARARSS